MRLYGYFQSASAISLDANDTKPIRDVASTLAHVMVWMGNGNATGQMLSFLPQPDSLYDAGFMWATPIDYWYYTGDTTYKNITTEALLAQASSTEDCMLVNQTEFETNASQYFLGLAAMSVAEYKFPNLPER